MQPNFVVKLCKGFGKRTRDINGITHFTQLWNNDQLRFSEGPFRVLELPPEVIAVAHDDLTVRPTTEAEFLRLAMGIESRVTSRLLYVDL